MTRDPARFGKVAVLMGGTAGEREVSLKSGHAVLAALQRQGVDAHAVDTRERTLEQLIAGRFDRAFIALHGRGGEDGVIQGALETLGVPYTGSGVLASALGMHKLRCKQIWQSTGLSTARWMQLEPGFDPERVAQELGLPVMIKPVREGSSLGIAKVTSAAELTPAWAAAAALDDCVIAEAFIEGGEYTVAILADEALPAIRLETPRTFYDYEAKYHADSTRYHCPCGLAADEERALGELALAGFRAIDARGWGRVDFMRDRAGRMYLLEINTVPGMTDHSLVPMAARAAGMDFDALVWRILETAR